MRKIRVVTQITIFRKNIPNPVPFSSSCSLLREIFAFAKCLRYYAKVLIYCTITWNFPENMNLVWHFSKYRVIFRVLCRIIDVTMWNNLIISWMFATFCTKPLRSRIVLSKFRVIRGNICISSQNWRYLAQIGIFARKSFRNFTESSLFVVRKI